MTGSTMGTFITRNAAAALLTVGVVRSGGAQAQVEVRTRDSLVVLRIAPSPAQLDSFRVLMSTLEQLPRGSRARAEIDKQLKAMMPPMPTGNRVVFRNPSGFAGPRGWIGINAQGPHNEFITPQSFIIQYFDYPSIASVDPDSPAQRAGIVAGDVLVEYDGTDLVGHKFDLTQMLIPDKRLGVTVRRDGEMKEFAVTVAPAPENIFVRRRDLGGPGEMEIHVVQGMRDERSGRALAGPGFPFLHGLGGNGRGTSFTMLMTPNGAFGAILSSVGPELAKAFRIETGVLVNDVTEDTPASRAGLHTGDVIVTAAGQPVPSLKKLQELIAKHIPDQSIALQVVRDRKSRKVTVSW
jgi:membrane-associated protease RseP (regulator of RpoE activity)